MFMDLCKTGGEEHRWTFRRPYVRALQCATGTGGIGSSPKVFARAGPLTGRHFPRSAESALQISALLKAIIEQQKGRLVEPHDRSLGMQPMDARLVPVWVWRERWLAGCKT
jgi:hypothetical protein